MNLEDYRNFCLSLEDATEDFPFDKRTLVIKIKGKIFTLFDIEDFKTINLKCDPEKAIELREKFNGIIPGFHMNKKHWNTIALNSDVSDDLILELTKHSYALIRIKIKK